MDTSFWTSLKANNDKIKFEGSKTLKRGFTSSLVLEDRWLYITAQKSGGMYYNYQDSLTDSMYWDERYKTEATGKKFYTKAEWLKKNKSLIEKKRNLASRITAYAKEHKEVKFQIGYWHTTVYGDESDLIALLTTFPDIAEMVSKISIPSSDDAEKLLREGYILTKTLPTMPFRAKTKAGYIKKASLEKVLKQVERSPDKFAISGWFRSKVIMGNNYRWSADGDIWMGSSNIYFQNEHDIGLFALIDNSLTKRIEKMSIDPSVNEIAKLNKVKKIVKKTKKLAAERF